MAGSYGTLAGAPDNGDGNAAIGISNKLLSANTPGKVVAVLAGGDAGSDSYVGVYLGLAPSTSQAHAGNTGLDLPFGVAWRDFLGWVKAGVHNGTTSANSATTDDSHGAGPPPAATVLTMERKFDGSGNATILAYVNFPGDSNTYQLQNWTGGPGSTAAGNLYAVMYAFRPDDGSRLNTIDSVGF